MPEEAVQQPIVGTGGDTVDVATPPDEVESPLGQRREDTEKTGEWEEEKEENMLWRIKKKIGVVKKNKGMTRKVVWRGRKAKEQKCKWAKWAK